MRRSKERGLESQRQQKQYTTFMHTNNLPLVASLIAGGRQETTCKEENNRQERGEEKVNKQQRFFLFMLTPRL